MKPFLNKIIPHILVVAAFAALSAIYFYPAFNGYQLRQGDITHFKGMSQEIAAFRDMYGEEPLWTNSMFGGMPAYQISVRYPNDVLGFIDDVVTLGLPRPADYLFLYFLGFYLLLAACGARPGLAAIGAVAFGLSSYFLVIIEAGHNSKAHAIGYMAPVLAGFIWAYRGKVLLGTAVTALFVALQIHANHVQITYYFGFLLLAFAIAKLVEAVRNHTLPTFAKTTGLLAVAGVVALLANANMLYNTYQYGKYTTRGATELTIAADGSSNVDNTTGGLDRDYVTQWSYGIGESLSFLIPNARGGPSGVFGADSDAIKKVSRPMQQNVAQSNAYWGDQPFTSGPVYMGSIVVFLFVLGAFFIKGPVKWALLIVALLTVALSWGSNFMGLTNLFLDIVPGYDKFRAVTIILAITELIIPLLGFLFLKQLFDNIPAFRAKEKTYFIISGIVLGILALLALAPAAFMSFVSAQEGAMLAEQMSGPNAAQMLDYIEGLKAARMALFQADAWRSFFFILLTAAIVWAVGRAKIKPTIAIAALGVLIIADLWLVDKRYLNNEKDRGKLVAWQLKEEGTAAYMSAEADRFIIGAEMEANPRVADAVEQAVAEYRAENRASKPEQAEIENVRFAALRFATNYRVLPLSGTFQDARTAYFHKSLGGYHGAKLRRIQELYDFHIVAEIQKLNTVFQNQPTVADINTALFQSPALNMLNVKYIIYNPQAPPLENPSNIGSAWFVGSLRQVADADEEIRAIGTLDFADEAVVDKRFSDLVKDFSFQEAPDAAITVVDHLPNYIKYTYQSPVPQAVIFSEIYYPEGWNAYIDGNQSPYFRANYLLRGMIVPSGNHTIEFKFEPSSFATASTVSLVSACLIILLFGGLLYSHFKASTNRDELVVPGE